MNRKDSYWIRILLETENVVSLKWEMVLVRGCIMNIRVVGQQFPGSVTS
jgi:hypothetical protein